MEEQIFFIYSMFMEEEILFIYNGLSLPTWDL